MEEVYADLTALGDYLARVQEQRLTRLAFRLEADLSLPQMHRALDMLLPMVQRHTRCIRRDRQGYAVTATLGYRTGVRLADAWRTGDLSHLTAKEHLTLTCGEGILRQVPRALPPEEWLPRLTGILASRVNYRCPLPGRPGYAAVVDAAGALVRGQANCQGISDGMYLLGSMAGLDMGYKAGWNRHGPHLWNTVRLDGAWFFLDATAALRESGSAALLDERASLESGLRWERWAETVPVGKKAGILASG